MNESDKKALKRIIETQTTQKEFFKRARKLKINTVTKLFNDLHQDRFYEMDCLECANCCLTISPLLTDKDIERAAAFLKISKKQFRNEYVTIDEDDDQVFNKIPCPFLMSDNYCLIYRARPKACSHYPHTDEKMTQVLISNTEENAKICPAVARIVTDLQDKI